MKICTKCKVKRPLCEFSSHKKTKDGLQAQCKSCYRAYSREYYKRNKGKIAQYFQDNKEKIYIRRNIKRKKNIQIILAHNLRVRLNSALKNNQKLGSAVKDLGCSIDELKKHLESQFQNGMSWDNYGDWHLDHCVPLSEFDLTNKSQFLKACSWTNLQPLWAPDNLKKSNKISISDISLKNIR